MHFTALLNGEHDDIFTKTHHTYEKNGCVIFVAKKFDEKSSARVRHNKSVVYCIMHKKNDDHVVLLMDPCARKNIPMKNGEADIDIMVRYT